MLAFITFVMWGFSPIYLSAVRYATAWELWGVRTILFVPFMALYIGWDKQWPKVRDLLRNRRQLLATCLSALLIAANNILFMYIVNIGRALECSLSNFILPLVSIFFGVVCFRERLNPAQWLAVALAAGGVAALTAVTGEAPRYALVMSVMFATYAVVRKAAGLPAVASSFLEMVLAAPLAVAVLWALHNKGLMVFGRLSLGHDALLMFSVIFFLPGYIMYNQAIKVVDLSLLGFMQYVTPILQFIFAILVLKEHFTWDMGLCYLAIWAALMIFSLATFRKKEPPALEN